MLISISARTAAKPAVNDRVVTKFGNNEWYSGTVTRSGPTKVTVTFDDGDTKSFTDWSSKVMKPISSKKKRKNSLTNAEVARLAGGGSKAAAPTAPAKPARSSRKEVPVKPTRGSKKEAPAAPAKPARGAKKEAPAAPAKPARGAKKSADQTVKTGGAVMSPEVRKKRIDALTKKLRAEQAAMRELHKAYKKTEDKKTAAGITVLHNAKWKKPYWEKIKVGMTMINTLIDQIKALGGKIEQDESQLGPNKDDTDAMDYDYRNGLTGDKAIAGPEVQKRVNNAKRKKPAA